MEAHRRINEARFMKLKAARHFWNMLYQTLQIN